MLKSISHHLSLYAHFLKMYIKRIKLYPVDFILGNVGFFLDTISNLFVLYIIMTTTQLLGEFNGYQMLFFYSFLMLVGALWEIFFVTVLEVPYMIRTGELDIFLLRPLNLLYQFIIFQIDEESILETLFATGLLAFSIFQLPNTWHILFFVKLIVFLISAILVKYAIYLLLSSTAFWWVSNDGLKSILWEISQLGSYPLSIYPLFLKVILIVLPFSFIGYFPVRDLVIQPQQFTIESIINASIGIVVLYFVYHTIWKWGLKKYQSSGG